MGISIRECVQQHGWAVFRQYEREVITAFVAPQPCVLDCGGGVVEDAVLMDALQQMGLVVWVDAELADIQQRLAHDTTRPLLNQNDRMRDIEENYTRRRPMYQRYAALYINTSAMAIDACVEQVAQQTKDML